MSQQGDEQGATDEQVAKEARISQLNAEIAEQARRAQLNRDNNNNPPLIGAAAQIILQFLDPVRPNRRA